MANSAAFTTARPSCWHFPRKRPVNLTTLRLAIALVNRDERAAAVSRLAAHAGACALFVLIEDPELGTLVPAPGLVSTLPGGRAWRDLLACRQPGLHRVRVPTAPAEPPVDAIAIATAYAVMVFVGEHTDLAVVEDAGEILPAIGSALRVEQQVVAARGAMRAAQESVRDGQALADALDRARADLELKARSLTEARARAEDATRAKDEFLAMLGHELRNPLAPITTALHLMRMRGMASREQDIIERQVAHVTRLVDDLLDVARITQGKIELRRECLELGAVTARAIEMVGPLLEQRQQVLRVDVASAGLAVDADPERLAQVIANLLTNASRYSATASRIVVTGERDGEVVRLSVIDQGIGIAPEMLSRIFETFVQAPPSSDTQRGLGLGLAIVRSMVHLHGGTVSARSAGVGQGSQFVVELPASADINPPRRRAAPGPANEPTTLRGLSERVLIVDDNTDANELLAEMLASLGFVVCTAADGDSAIARAADFKPAIALLDIGLPGIDGYELARQLRDLSGDSIRFVAVTGFGQDVDRARSRVAGFDAHLVKPVEPELLHRVLTELRHQTPPPSY